MIFLYFKSTFTYLFDLFDGYLCGDKLMAHTTAFKA